MIFFHSFRNPGLIIDIVSDIRAINNLALKAKKAGMIILGGGVCKHQIANAMLMVRDPAFLANEDADQMFSSYFSGMVPITPFILYVLAIATVSLTLSVTTHLRSLYSSQQNTGQEFDGSDSGARPDESVSWGKIRAGSESFKV